MSFADTERTTGARFSWNCWPPTRKVMAEAIVPLGCVYTPLAQTENLQYSQFEPLKCKKGCYLNPYCQIDYHNKSWVCCFDGEVNPFPPHYAGVLTEQNRPPELQGQNLEVWFPAAGNAQQEVHAPVFLFVVDLTTKEDELKALKAQLQRVVVMLPPGARVGLISYGTMAFVHELGFRQCPRSIVFKGTKELKPEQVLSQLNIPVRSDPRGAMTISPAAERFFARADQLEDEINNVINHLRTDSWEAPKGHRPAACVGTALTIAQALMEGCAGGYPGRVMLFTSAPCTVGPGLMVEPSRKESFRSHSDIEQENNNARHVKKALEFYSGLTQRMVKANHAFDIFAAAMDQVGLMEMKILSDRTGGVMVMTDSFTQHVFDKSLSKLFASDPYTQSLSMGFKAKLEVVTSKDVKICGVIGPCASIGTSAPNVSSAVRVGEAATKEWVFGAIEKTTSVALYLEIANDSATTPPGQYGFVQFRTHYTAANGQRRLRVTTLACPYADPEQPRAALAAGFDQEAALSLMARYAVFKAESASAEGVDVLRWLDRSLIRLVAYFADGLENADTLMLPPQFLYYPKFMYHLRRSRFLHLFGSSPDETAWHRGVLCRENVLNSVVMVQPTLVSYSVQQPTATPVNLDIQSLRPDVLLLLDTFFEVVTWKGPDVIGWVQGGWLDKPGYEGLKALIEAPNTDAVSIIDSRFPTPRFVSAFAGGSQERFLKATVNPSVTQSDPNNTAPGVTAVLTDDVSFERFYAYLKKLVVSQKN